MRTGRLAELDALRGIAACGVMLFHYLWRYDELYGHTFTAPAAAYYGQFFVHLFFIISGFVIFWTMERVQDVRQFAWLRFGRLFPAYWVCLAITFLTVAVFGLPGREVSAAHALTNTLMFHDLLFVPHVDGVYWSLRVELTFYVWVAVLWRLNGAQNITTVLLAWMGASLAALAVLEQGSYFVAIIVRELLIAKYAFLFAIGVVCYRLFSGKAERSDGLVIAAAFASNFYIYAIHEAAFIAGCMALMLAVTRYGRVLRHGALIWLGSISYPLYLIHQNVGYIVIRETYEMGAGTAIACAVVAAVAISWAVHRYVELPCLEWMRDHLGRSRRKLDGMHGDPHRASGEV